MLPNVVLIKIILKEIFVFTYWLMNLHHHGFCIDEKANIDFSFLSQYVLNITKFNHVLPKLISNKFGIKNYCCKESAKNEEEIKYGFDFFNNEIFSGNSTNDMKTLVKYIIKY